MRTSSCLYSWTEKGHSVLWPSEDHWGVAPAAEASDLLPDEPGPAAGAPSRIAPWLCHHPVGRPIAAEGSAGELYPGRFSLVHSHCIGSVFLIKMIKRHMSLDLNQQFEIQRLEQMEDDLFSEYLKAVHECCFSYGNKAYP